jgi:hypothetical protein
MLGEAAESWKGVSALRAARPPQRLRRVGPPGLIGRTHYSDEPAYRIAKRLLVGADD